MKSFSRTGATAIPTAIQTIARKNKLRLLPLVAATYFMVSGGPYGLEDIIGKAGYMRGLLMLAVLPFLWSLPTALMVGELASAIPCDGGFYVWVHRALGRFWGFQEAWLSLAASVFDMAIYPTIFVAYLSRIAPTLTLNHRATVWALAVVVTCAAWNLKGAKAVGEGSMAGFLILMSPFLVLIAVAFWRWHGHGLGALREPIAAPDIATAVAVCLWNYMGWDNASTVAQEVDNPQRNYPRAMVTSAFLVAGTYMLPVLAVGLAGVAATQFSSDANGGTGTWTDVARTLVGPVIAIGVVIGGMISGAGMFNSLMMSYVRLPYAMAEDHMLPEALTRRNDRNAPWVSILFCAIIWALALSLTFERLISIDLVLYGSSLILEFVALVVLRRRQPHLHRPFRIPGGIPGTIAVGVFPTLLIFYAMWSARAEKVLGLPALVFAALVGFAGALVYAVTQFFRRRTSSMPVEPLIP